MKISCSNSFITLKPIESMRQPIFIALLFTTIYCLPGLSLFIKVVFFHAQLSIDNSGINYAIYSDGGLAYTPQLANLAYQLKHFTLQGVDFFTDNGASEFFVRANMTIFYPLAMFLAFVMKAYTFKRAALVYFLLIYSHLFLASLFLILLGRQFFNLSKAESVFFAMLVVFSYIYACNLYELTFFMAFSLFPMILYVMLITPFIKKKLIAILLSFIYFSYIFVGYLPLPLFGLLYSFLFSLCYFFYIKPELYPNPYSAVKSLLIPLIIGCVVAVPGCLAIVKFVHYASSPGLRGLDYAAYSLPERFKDFILFLLAETTHPLAQPSAMLKLSPFYTVIWFLFLIIGGKLKLSQALIPMKLFKITLLFAGITILISFGISLQLSTVFYYLVPALGEMHQYQRYFGFGIVFFALATTIAFRNYIEINPIKLTKILVSILFIVTIVMSLYLELYPSTKLPTIITEATLIQYFLLCLTFGLMLIFNKTGRWYTATFFGIVMALSFIYPIQVTTGNSPSASSIVLDRSKDENNNFIAFLRGNSNKDLIKYVNLSNNIFTFIPLNYPWVVSDRIKLSTYIGYEPHLSQDQGYQKHIHTYGDYEIDWLRRTGAEFVIYDQDAYRKFKDFINRYTDPSIMFPLSSGEIAVKLKPSFTRYMDRYSQDVTDNGYIALLHTKKPSILSNFKASASAIKFHLTINDDNSRLVLPFFANRHLHLYLNNNEVPLKKEKDMYYYEFKQQPGNYVIAIKYRYVLLTVFLFSMMFYYFVLLMTGILYLYQTYLRDSSSSEASKVEVTSI